MQLDQVLHIDAREGIKQLPDNSIDSIVTDPPYEIGFMENWDQTGVAYDTALWRECLRVLKPGGHLLAFGSARTYHRLAVAIEDAGFEIRDKADYFHGLTPDIMQFIASLSDEQLEALERIAGAGDGFLSWIYSQGFVKAQDLGKQIDRLLGAERKVIGKNPHFRPSHASPDLTTAATPETQAWEGWRASLKPANEPICFARKPLSEKNLAQNVLRHGTGALNEKACRIGNEPIATVGTRNGSGNTYFGTYTSREDFQGETRLGRFPSNVVLDQIAAAWLDQQGGVRKSGANAVRRKPSAFFKHGGLGHAGDVQTTYGDSGGASRFYYVTKARFPSQRGENNRHPTVKPLDLISYLVRLVTPPGGVSLDLFVGSGTHPSACIRLGVHYIGFENKAEYMPLINNRIAEAQKEVGENHATSLG